MLPWFDHQLQAFSFAVARYHRARLLPKCCEVGKAFHPLSALVRLGYCLVVRSFDLTPVWLLLARRSAFLDAGNHVADSPPVGRS